MFASVILVSMVCYFDDNKKCQEPTFEKVYVSQSWQGMKADAIDCGKNIDSLPDIETINKESYRRYGCFTVDYQTKGGFGYLENILDPDDSFMVPVEKLEVE